MSRRPLMSGLVALAMTACAGLPPAAGTASTAYDLPPAAALTAPAKAPAPGTDLGELYRYLHANPELSFKEATSAAILAAELEVLGFSVARGVGDAWVRRKALTDTGEVRPGVAGYGVVGVFENGPGPVLLIRADMDALPVPEATGLAYASRAIGETWTGVTSPVMHACGHDIHMTVWAGTARRLIAAKDQWRGTLVMIAQPAEELGLGAIAMIDDGLYKRFPRPDYNLALHVSASAPAGTVAYSSGYALAAVDSVDIKVKGRGGHGAYPHTTIDPVLVASHIVIALQSLVSRNTDPQDAAVVTVGSFKAGAKHNIIPDEAELLLTVRSYDDATRTMLLDGIRRIAAAQAEAFGAPPPEIKLESDAIPATYNDPDLTSRVMPAIGRAIGAANVVPVKPVMGGEDFSQFARTPEKIPGLIFWLGAVEPGRYAAAQADGMPLPSLHSSLFAPDYATAIPTGVEALTAAALELLGKP